MDQQQPVWKSAVRAGVMFAGLMGLFATYDKGWPSDAAQLKQIAFMALLYGVLFGGGIALFLRSGIIPKSKDLPLTPGEEVIFSGLAQHYRNFEGRGGRLALTNTQVLFVPHWMNFQHSKLMLPRSDIVSVEKSRVLPEGIRVKTMSGKTEVFVVNKRDEWLQKFAAA